MSACPECGEDTAHGHWPFCNTAVIDGLRQRAERAEAKTVELEAAIKRQASAALAGMNAVKAVSSWEMQEARRLKAECSPASVASQREANERLTTELESAQSTIAELRGQVERMRDFVGELADESCVYGDDCPPFANTRHGTCLSCRARTALGDAS